MKYVLFILTFAILAVPQVTLAQGGIVTCQGPECNFCSAIDMVNGIINWLFTIVVFIAVLLIAYAGALLVFSQGDPGAVSKGKEMLTNAIIGIVIMFAAWTIVDTLMKLAVGGEFGIWNEVTDCGEGAFTTGVADGYLPNLRNYEEGSVNAPEGPEAGIDNGGGEIISVANGGEVTFAFSGSLAVAQQGHLSGTLSSFQACVADRIEPGLYTITSVSDNKVANGTYSWSYCAQNGQSGGCAHSAGSCHYGGSSCVGSSYALDIRTSNLNAAQKSSVLSAAGVCGGWGQNEGNHLHISKGTACGCN